MSPAEKRYWGGVREENLRLYHTIQVAMFYFQIWIFLQKKSSFLVGVGFPNMDQNQTIEGEQRSKASPHVWLSSKQKSSPSRCLASLSQTKKNSSSFFSKFCHLLVVMLPCFFSYFQSGFIQPRTYLSWYTSVVECSRWRSLPGPTEQETGGKKVFLSHPIP